MVTKSKTGQVVLNIVFIILAVWAVAPFLLLISSSLSSEAALAQYGYGFWPKEFSLNAYMYLFKSSMKIAKGYGITLIVTLVGTTLSVLITTMFAYPLSRKELPSGMVFPFRVLYDAVQRRSGSQLHDVDTDFPYQKHDLGSDHAEPSSECVLRHYDAFLLYGQHSGCPYRGSQN